MGKLKEEKHWHVLLVNRANCVLSNNMAADWQGVRDSQTHSRSSVVLRRRLTKHVDMIEV